MTNLDVAQAFLNSKGLKNTTYYGIDVITSHERLVEIKPKN